MLKNYLKIALRNIKRHKEYSCLIVCASLVFSISLIFDNCSRKDDFPILKGPYLGQKPPSLLPEVFAPGIISTSELNERDVSFSSDRKELYFTQWPRDGGWDVMCMRQENGQWRYLLGGCKDN